MKYAKQAWLLVLFLFCGCIFYRLEQRYWNSDLKITFWDVGQGDAALVEFPYGYRMLIDAGGGFGQRDLGTRVLFPELARMGVLGLDVGLLTHPDADHAQGFLELLDHIHFKNLWLNKAFEKSPTQLLWKIIEKAKQKKTKIISWSGEYDFEIHQVKLKLFSFSSAKKAYSNNRSLVLHLQFGSCEILFTGDIHQEKELELLSKNLSLDVLKVAHHGSRTSTHPQTLEKWKPQLAIISAGLKNSYGHPHLEVSQRLSHKKTQVLRTDFHGYVRLKISKFGLIDCETFQGSCGKFRCKY